MIRSAGPEDAGLIRALCLQVWPQTYAPILAPEQIDYMLEGSYTIGSLERQMAAGQQFLILEDGAALGFASWTRTGDGTAHLNKLYVLPHTQGKGYGRALLNRVSESARASGATALTLNVNRYNKALDFYLRCGFSVLREEDIDIGNGYWMNDYVLMRQFDPSRART